MTSSIFPDVNVWLALSYPAHSHHSIADAWFGSLDQPAGLVFCRQTQLSLFRLMTTVAVLGPDVRTQSQCWDFYDNLIASGKARFAEEPIGLDAPLRRRSHSRSASPKVWADAYLAAFAEAARMTLVTFDQALAGKENKAILLR